MVEEKKPGVKIMRRVIAVLVYCFVISGANASSFKNIILLVGDGMGPGQIALLQTYLTQNNPNKVTSSWIKKLANQGTLGMVDTHPYGHLVVDSASSATQMSTGQYALPEMVGLNYKGESAQTILEMAKDLGKSTGLVSNTRVTHATPAAFAAHNPHRANENEIAMQMVDSKADIMLSGGLRHFLPKHATQNEFFKTLVPSHLSLSSKRSDNKNLLAQAQANGYSLVFTKEQLKKSTGSKILGTFSSSGMLGAITAFRKEDKLTKFEPTLEEMTKKSLEVLSKNPKGFFLMVEGGQIDWAGHNNDTGQMLHEMLSFDQTVGMVYEWAKNRDDTLIVVTADHETGSFGFSYSMYQIPQKTKVNEKVDFSPRFNFVSPSVLTKIFHQKKSYFEIFEEFDGLPKKNKGPTSLMKIVNANSDFKITYNDAVNILKQVKNPYQDKNHKYLKANKFPLIHDFFEFNPYGDEGRMVLLGRTLAKQQGTIWGTGTHTTSPVYAVAWAKDKTQLGAYQGYYHMIELGKKLQHSLGAKGP